MRKFFMKHLRLAQFLCKHVSSNDIGVLETWDGNKWLISQCCVCGMIIVNGKRYRNPKEIYY